MSDTWCSIALTSADSDDSTAHQPATPDADEAKVPAKVIATPSNLEGCKPSGDFLEAAAFLLATSLVIGRASIPSPAVIPHTTLFVALAATATVFEVTVGALGVFISVRALLLRKHGDRTVRATYFAIASFIVPALAARTVLRIGRLHYAPTVSYGCLAVLSAAIAALCTRAAIAFAMLRLIARMLSAASSAYTRVLASLWHFNAALCAFCSIISYVIVAMGTQRQGTSWQSATLQAGAISANYPAVSVVMSALAFFWFLIGAMLAAAGTTRSVHIFATFSPVPYIFALVHTALLRNNDAGFAFVLIFFGVALLLQIEDIDCIITKRAIVTFAQVEDIISQSKIPEPIKDNPDNLTMFHSAP